MEDCNFCAKKMSKIWGKSSPIRMTEGGFTLSEAIYFFWTSRDRRCHPFSPLIRAFVFIAHTKLERESVVSLSFFFTNLPEDKKKKKSISAQPGKV